MKLSVSLPDRDIAFLDDYARTHGLGSRSRALREALALLRVQELSADYGAAWQEWTGDDANAAWDATIADGIDGSTDAQPQSHPTG